MSETLAARLLLSASLSQLIEPYYSLFQLLLHALNIKLRSPLPFIRNVERYFNLRHGAHRQPITQCGCEAPALQYRERILIQPVTKPFHNLQHRDIAIGFKVRLYNNVALNTELASFIGI